MIRFLFSFFLFLLPIQAFAFEGELVVPARTIYPGETINISDLSLRAFELREGQAQAYFRAPDMIGGKIAKRTLLANQPVPLGAIEEPRLALIGRQIKVEYRQDGLIISTLGSVLQPGGAGDVISVRILDGGRTVFGTLQKDGTLRVGEGDS